MARTIWKGSISFGLVNIPVKVVGAVSAKDISFNMLHAKDGARIRFKRMCSAEDKEVSNEEIVKGYELASGQYVTFTDEELDSINPEASRTIDIMDFVPLADIDPAYFDKPYYLVPDKNAEKPYALFLQAIKRAKRVGIAHVVMREKQYLVALRVREDVLMMETMHHEEEMIAPSTVAAEADLSKHKVDEREVAMAEKLIESLSTDFDPTAYKDDHRERILAMVERKAAGDEVIVQPTAKPSVRTTDLMSALERSLAAVRERPHGRPSRAKAKAERETSRHAEADEEEAPAKKGKAVAVAETKKPKKKAA